MGIENKALGSLGENFAEEYLIQDEYEIIARNYRCKSGEIDIIATKNRTLYFVEVKTRRSKTFGSPAEAVTQKKQLHMRRAAASFLQEEQFRGYSVEFKVIEVFVNVIDDVII